MTREYEDYEECDYVEQEMRTIEEIQDYENEAFEKVWLMRNAGLPAHDPRNNAIKQAKIETILETYDDIPADGFTDWECGYWNGIMGALRWVMGDDKDFLDT